ncbi:MAG: hypothetical protein ACKO2P_15445, partial [Planctomycetota bacterium]
MESGRGEPRFGLNVDSDISVDVLTLFDPIPPADSVPLHMGSSAQEPDFRQGVLPGAQPQDGSPQATPQPTPLRHHSTTRAPPVPNHSRGLPPNRSAAGRQSAGYSPRKRPCNSTPLRAHLRCQITAGGCRPTAQPQDGSPRDTAQQTPVQHH